MIFMNEKFRLNLIVFIHQFHNCQSRCNQIFSSGLNVDSQGSGVVRGASPFNRVFAMKVNYRKLKGDSFRLPLSFYLNELQLNAFFV
jgi:hypothetical protein